MSKFKLKSDPAVKRVIDNYPKLARTQIKKLRQLIIESAKELGDITELEETLKWGEPSYLTKIGSTVRIAWKAKTPDQYAIYFKCTSKLVPTFKKNFRSLFQFEGDRAIAFRLDDKSVPVYELKKCIKAALRYHEVKLIQNLDIIK